MRRSLRRGGDADVHAGLCASRPTQKGSRWRFQARATASKHWMICSGRSECVPDRARRTTIRWMDSARLSQLPPNGVKSTIAPCAVSQQSSSANRWPARLSQINSIRSGVSSCTSVKRTESPAGQLSHSARFSCALLAAAWRGSPVPVPRLGGEAPHSWRQTRPGLAPLPWRGGRGRAASLSRRAHTRAGTAPKCPPLPSGCPAGVWLVRTGRVLIPQRQPLRLSLPVGALDQRAFCPPCLGR